MAANYKLKSLKVELDVSNVNTDQTKNFVNELANQYADLVVSNVNVESNKVTFDVGSPSMDDLTANDIKFRITEFLSMNVPPFSLKSVNVR